MKKKYIQPLLALTFVQSECSIAMSSIHLGPDKDPFVPDVEDFFEDNTDIKGIGEI